MRTWLTAIRETKRRQIENYFRQVRNHVLALSTDESTIEAVEQMRKAWRSLPALETGTEAERALRRFYDTEFAQRVAGNTPEETIPGEWYPRDPRQRGLQSLFLAGNPYPAGSKDLYLEPTGGGRYGEIHARYHPTLHRYQSAFGFYDILLIDAEQGRVLYTVFKEIDLGARVSQPPYQTTGLGRAFTRAIALSGPEQTVMEDFAFYMPSGLEPAAFVAAPIWRAGAKLGVLTIQVPIAEIDRVCNNDGNWRQEGLGESGRIYLVGPDDTFRSDDRIEIERPEDYYANLVKSGVPPESVERARRTGTGILTIPVVREVAAARAAGVAATGIGHDRQGRRVVRSYAPVRTPELQWMLVAEIDEAEVLEPVARLRKRILWMGAAIAVVFLAAAWWLARSVTRPVLRLAGIAERLGAGNFRVPVPVESDDEIGQLARSFRTMAEDLERTTVRRDELDLANRELTRKQAELHELTERLIEAQEQERRRIARELHDDLTQRLAALAIDAGTLRRTADGDGERLLTGLERIRQQIGAISTDVHSLSRRLHPAILEDLGLAAAIEAECRGFFERGGPPVDFRSNGDPDSLPDEVQLGLYRIVQEALRNTGRHAAAEHVEVSLLVQPDAVRLEIRDDGRGFAPANRAGEGGLGLASMQERVRLLKGSFDIDSKVGVGTLIRVSIPLLPEER
jgi:signal transduction histidine kinase